MKCFNHSGADAVGVCRACSKGLCADCAVDHGYAISCRGDCESEAKLLRSQTISSRTLISAQKRYKNFIPAFFTIAGAFFLATSFTMQKASGFMIAMGAIFVGFGIVAYFANKRWVKESEPDGV